MLLTDIEKYADAFSEMTKAFIALAQYAATTPACSMRWTSEK